MTDSKQVKAALAALADGDAPRKVETDESTAGRASASSLSREDSESGAVSGQPAEYRAVIKRASKATDDVEAAAAFVEEVGVARLETAVADAERELSGLAEEGQDALAAFERFRAAADGSTGERRRD